MLNKNPSHYAHTPPEGAQNRSCEYLSEHLFKVARQTKQFIESIVPENKELADVAFLSGYLHDLGKYRPEFQEYLFDKRESSKETHHAPYGAAAAAYQCSCLEAAFVIAGHHSGLHNISGLGNQFKDKDYSAKEKYAELLELLKTEAEDISEVLKPSRQGLPQTDAEKYRFDVRVRMLFSCLVDADRLKTEEYAQGALPSPPEFQAATFLELLRTRIKSLGSGKDDSLQRLRDNILTTAIESAEKEPGFFSMTVPTGGGKTLSSMVFALAHARKHGLRRVIVVIPYLSIIEQNAGIYREILGKDIVIEHHSSVVQPENQGDENETQDLSYLELAVENWDAPIIVTTSVQFIESLFARSPSRCRKLHNIARSVVVMDEVQAMPSHLLNPTLSILQELVKSYGTSILLCSATQPGFIRNMSLPEGFDSDQVREIAPDPPELFNKLRRVRYHLPEKSQKLSWGELAGRLMEINQALVVVNTRKHAFDLWQKLDSVLDGDKKEGLFHLSSSMCAEHRHDILEKIRGRLKNKLSCHLVSTQLIEAGVDVDFPVVYRAMGPLDSIVQVAGRCNREGKLPDMGNVHIFYPEDGGIPPGSYNTATCKTAGLLCDAEMEEKLGTDPSLFQPYFASIYGMIGTDHNRRGEKTIQEDRKSMKFKTVAEHARVIKDQTISVVVPYGRGEELIKEIRGKWNFTRYDLRRLQRFMVSVRDRDFRALEVLGAFTELRSGVDIQVTEEYCYSPELGLKIKQRPLEDYTQ